MAVMGLSEVGRSPARLADAIDGLGREILDHVADLFGHPADPVHDGPGVRRSLIGRVAALDPLVDQAIGESPELRHRKAILHDAMAGLFAALSGWRIAGKSPREPRPGRCRTRGPRRGRVPARDLGVGSARSPRTPATSVPTASPTSRPTGATIWPRRATSPALKAEGGVSQRLLADAAAQVALGLAGAANALALLRPPGVARDPAHPPGFVVADTLPAVVNAIRTFVSIAAALAFWILTGWPNGLGAVTFMAVTVLLLAPQQEKSARASLGFGLGTVITACLAAIVDFALPAQPRGVRGAGADHGGLSRPPGGTLDRAGLRALSRGRHDELRAAGRPSE